MDNTTYKHVYFYIDSGYRWGEGMSADANEKFTEEITELFRENGWTVFKPKFSSSCPTVQDGVNSLYLHPIEVCGTLEADRIEEVEKILDQGKTFVYYEKNIAGNVYNWTDEEIVEHLNSKRKILESIMLDKLRTKRSNLYVPCSINYGVPHDMALSNKVKTPSKLYGMSSDDVEVTYMWNLLQTLVKEGKVIEAETKRGKAYRTAKKEEQNIA